MFFRLSSQRIKKKTVPGTRFVEYNKRRVFPVRMRARKKKGGNMPAKGAIFTGPRAFPARGDLDSQNRRPPLRNALSKKVGGRRATRFMAQFVCCRGGGFQIANGRPQARPNGLNGRRRSCFSKCGSSARAARPIKVFGGRRGRRARRNYEESARDGGGGHVVKTRA